MSKLRDDANAEILFARIYSDVAHVDTKQAKRVLILLDAIELVGNRYGSLNGKDAYYIMLGAIKRAEEV